MDLLYRKRSENWKEDIKVVKLLEQHGAIYGSVTKDQSDLVANKKYFDQFIVEHPYIGHVPIHNSTNNSDCDVDGLISILKSILLDTKYFYDEKIYTLVNVLLSCNIHNRQKLCRKFVKWYGISLTNALNQKFSEYYPKTCDLLVQFCGGYYEKFSENREDVNAVLNVIKSQANVNSTKGTFNVEFLTEIMKWLVVKTPYEIDCCKSHLQFTNLLSQIELEQKNESVEYKVTKNVYKVW